MLASPLLTVASSLNSLAFSGSDSFQLPWKFHRDEKVKIIWDNSESAALVAPLSPEAQKKLVELAEDWFKAQPDFENDDEEE